MKRKIIFGIILLEIGILVGYVYHVYVVPQLIANPFCHDILSDYIGAQALIDKNQELYPILTTAAEKLGITWGMYHRSTHPPTSYLFVLPFAFLNYPLAQTLWMLTMFACIILSWRVLGLSWGKSILAGVLSLAWPPTIWSLGQLTPIWLLGLAVAYRYRDRPSLSGINIAIASLPKFLAAPSLLYHLWRRKWSALISFIATWLAALGIVLLFRPDAISTYISINSGEPLVQLLRPDNSALFPVAWRIAGWPGVVVVALLILYVLWIGLRTKGLLGWACLVWVGIALLPIAWVYSLLPLLPWLVIIIFSSSKIPQLIAILAMILPYVAPLITSNPWAISISIALSGISFASAAKLNKDLESNLFSIR